MMFRKNDNKYKKVGNHATNSPKCCTFAAKGLQNIYYILKEYD